MDCCAAFKGIWFVWKQNQIWEQKVVVRILPGFADRPHCSTMFDAANYFNPPTIAPLDLNINSDKFDWCRVQVNTTGMKWKRKEMCVRISWLTFLLALGSLTGDRNMLQAARAALHTRQLAQQTVWTPDIQTFSTQKKPAHKKTDG